MDLKGVSLLEFEDVGIDLKGKLIVRQGKRARISSDLWKLLLLFLERSPEPVARIELKLSDHESETARWKRVERLRRALGDNTQPRRLIQTHPTVGHAFIAIPSKIMQDNSQSIENSEISIPKPQRVRWGPVDGKPAGLCVESCLSGLFVSWNDLKPEVERMLLPQVRQIPIGSSVHLRSFRDRENWIVRIVDPKGNEVGDIWFGPDADKQWSFDGLVRLGEPDRRAPDLAVVWQTFQRYSDGSYRRVVRP
jgi:DNA-binding winged helix-turn-helix (wHTH) protein